MFIRVIVILVIGLLVITADPDTEARANSRRPLYVASMSHC